MFSDFCVTFVSNFSFLLPHSLTWTLLEEKNFFCSEKRKTSALIGNRKRRVVQWILPAFWGERESPAIGEEKKIIIFFSPLLMLQQNVDYGREMLTEMRRNETN
jgi:hypothetical protein